MPHTCISELGTDNMLLPVRRQVITWADADLVLTGYLGSNFSDIRMEIQNFHSW